MQHLGVASQLLAMAPHRAGGLREAQGALRVAGHPGELCPNQTQVNLTYNLPILNHNLTILFASFCLIFFFNLRSWKNGFQKDEQIEHRKLARPLLRGGQGRLIRLLLQALGHGGQGLGSGLVTGGLGRHMVFPGFSVKTAVKKTYSVCWFFFPMVGIFNILNQLTQRWAPDLPFVGCAKPNIR